MSTTLTYMICSSLTCSNSRCHVKVEVHGKAFVGYPLVALATVQFTEESACSWQWYRSSGAVSSSPRARKAVTKWLSVSAEGPVYVPTADDEGCMLRVTCRPPPPRTSEREVRAVHYWGVMAVCHLPCLSVSVNAMTSVVRLHSSPGTASV
jgi:hypothetical protein